MIAEVDPPDVGDIVGDDELLVVARRVSDEQGAYRVGHANVDAVRREFSEHRARGPHFTAQRPVGEGRGRPDKAIADYVTRIGIDQHTTVQRPARREGGRHPAAGGVAFEGHGLNVETPARSAGVLGGASPEAVGSPEKLQPCHRPYTFSRTTLPRGVGDG